MTQSNETMASLSATVHIFGWGWVFKLGHGVVYIYHPTQIFMHVSQALCYQIYICDCIYFAYQEMFTPQKNPP